MIYDTHTHSTNSDGRQSISEMCRCAIENNVSGFAVTDHADMNDYEKPDIYNRISKSMTDIAIAQEACQDSILLMRGVELGNYLCAPKNAEKLLAAHPFDVVLCAVHYVPKARFEQTYSRIPFSTDGTDDELRTYLRLYFELLNETVDAFDFDVLAHLTCPIRYITGLHQRPIDAMEFQELIQSILKKIIQRDIALEYNTAGWHQRFHNCAVQNDALFSLYRTLGGTRVTIGSDAHTAADIGFGFDKATAHLKQMGFHEISYYRDRKPLSIQI